MKFNSIKITSAVLIASIVGGGSLAIAGQKQISIRGSDTLLILNQRWAEEYAKAGGGSVAVSGGGSSIGINAFINGTTDICASSRQIKKSEVDKARGRGSISNEIPVALDGLAICVNADNKIESVTMDDLRRIYVGQITNWKELGGPNQLIMVFSRDSNSGTYGFFQQNVLRNQNWGKSVRFMPSTSEEVREVARNAGGIAYGGVAYFKGKKDLRIIPVAAKKGDTAYMPTEENVRSKKYPIWRYLYYYTNGKPTGDVKKFIDFALSAKGQALCEEVGYYSLK
ncbi:MAG: PstS family phosphate ABC transporter substrate-binding protein [Fimbriimonadaceae bacterium]|nr:PstS family phosphate ABC transporter substrate-binding protein [Fimbriimonadaceae bacterium]